MEIMENKHSFKATEKQYKKQLQKWDIDHKRIKPTEYKAMIRKKRQREEDGQKESKFQLRGVVIDDAKIVRFQKRHRISEQEHVYDCPTPPGLVCTTPTPILPSPDLRPFSWYNIYENYLDLSMAGSSTIQFDNVQSILRSLVVPFPKYEDECRSLGDWRIGKSYSIMTQHLGARDRMFFPTVLFLVDLGLGVAMIAPTIRDRAFKRHQPQKLLGYMISDSLHDLNNHNYSLSSLDIVGQLLVLWAAGTAGTIHRLSGRRGEAISLLETVINIVDEHLDSMDAIIKLFQGKLLIELAHCYLEDGRRDEARHLLITQLQVPPSFEEAIAKKGRSPDFGVFQDNFLQSRLRTFMTDVRELARGLDNGRADIGSIKEYHARMQEASCEPGTPEWGPFLTDCIEWDRI